jgi:hypothetical protein
MRLLLCFLVNIARHMHQETHSGLGIVAIVQEWLVIVYIDIPKRKLSNFESLGIQNQMQPNLFILTN